MGFKQKKAGKKLDFVFERNERWHEIGCWVSSKRRQDLGCWIWSKRSLKKLDVRFQAKERWKEIGLHVWSKRKVARNWMLGFEQKATRKKNSWTVWPLNVKKKLLPLWRAPTVKAFKYWTLLLHGFDLNWTSLQMVMNNNVYQDKMIIDVWCFWWELKDLPSLQQNTSKWSLWCCRNWQPTLGVLMPHAE